MKTQLICIFLLMGFLVCFGRPVFGQDTTHSVKIDTSKYTCILPYDEPPIPPGGQQGYIDFLKQNIKYPKEAIDAKASGTVYLSITIDTTGILSNVHIEKDNAHHGLGEEAIRVINMMPPWKPGKNGKGEIQKIRYVIPVKFTLP